MVSLSRFGPLDGFGLNLHIPDDGLAGRLSSAGRLRIRGEGPVQVLHRFYVSGGVVALFLFSLEVVLRVGGLPQRCVACVSLLPASGCLFLFPWVSVHRWPMFV